MNIPRCSQGTSSRFSQRTPSGYSQRTSWQWRRSPRRAPALAELLCEHPEDVLCEHPEAVLCEHGEDVLCEHRYNTNPQIQKLLKLQNFQNMNYGTYINNKNEKLFFFFQILRIQLSNISNKTINKNKSNVWNLFWYPWCILYNKWLFWISDSDSVYLTLYGNMV